MHAKGFENASPIQELTIPEILEGKDIFAQAETGSGKTGSFAIPILELLLRSDSKDQLYIVLSPTRELAQQTHQVFTDFATPLGIEVGCFIGGESFDRQKTVLNKNPQVLVATPGRFNDLMRQNLIDLKNCTGVVFDEADRLFDMGFKKDIESILRKVRQDRQLIMVSATSNQDVLRTAYQFRSHPIELKLNADDLLVEKINHEVAMISQDEKMPYLVHLLRNNLDAYAIVFCNTQYMTHLVAMWLEQMGFKAKAISGRMPQNKRTRLMEDFRNKEITILVCTDVAARGLDIKDVNLVVNYDMPSEAANYVHRIGRTGRAGKEGKAISFCAFEDCDNLEAISKYLGTSIPKADVEDEHFATDVCKKPRIDAKTLKAYEDKKPREERKARSEDGRPARRNAERAARERKQAATTKVTEQKASNTEKQYSAPAPKVYLVSDYQESVAKAQAQKYFGIEDDELLQWDVVEEGKKKYLLFGPKLKKYSFSVKPFYRKLLLPFFIELFKKMDLKIFVKVTFKAPMVRINFSGKDASELLKNKSAMLYALEQLAKVYLEKRIPIDRSLKLQLRVEKDQTGPKSEKELIALATKTMEKVLATKKPVTLGALDPAERRIIHQHINENKQFTSTSLGEGRFKKIKISLS